jgi:death-on-curing family protein
MKKTIQIITIKQVEYMSYFLAKEILSFNEPIPDFSTRFKNILESCLLTPFQRFSNRALYPDLFSKAAILFYLMVKNHPFQNGNKRIAMTTLLTFLYLNKKWVNVDVQEFYNFAMWTAQSPARLKDETVKAIEKFLKLYMVNL